MIKDIILLERKVFGQFSCSSFRVLLVDGDTQTHVDYTKVEIGGHFECYQYDGFSFGTLHELIKYAISQYVGIYTYIE